MIWAALLAASPVVLGEDANHAVWSLGNAIGTTAQYPRVWVYLDHARDQTESARTTQMLVEFSCGSGIVTMLTKIRLSASGKELSRWDTGYGPGVAEHVTPGTMWQVVYDRECGAAY